MPMHCQRLVLPNARIAYPVVRFLQLCDFQGLRLSCIKQDTWSNLLEQTIVSLLLCSNGNDATVPRCSVPSTAFLKCFKPARLSVQSFLDDLLSKMVREWNVERLSLKLCHSLSFDRVSGTQESVNCQCFLFSFSIG